MSNQKNPNRWQLMRNHRFDSMDNGIWCHSRYKIWVHGNTDEIEFGLLGVVPEELPLMVRHAFLPYKSEFNMHCLHLNLDERMLNIRHWMLDNNLCMQIAVVKEENWDAPRVLIITPGQIVDIGAYNNVMPRIHEKIMEFARKSRYKAAAYANSLLGESGHVLRIEKIIFRQTAECTLTQEQSEALGLWKEPFTLTRYLLVGPPIWELPYEPLSASEIAAIASRTSRSVRAVRRNS